MNRSENEEQRTRKKRQGRVWNSTIINAKEKNRVEGKKKKKKDSVNGANVDKSNF